MTTRRLLLASFILGILAPRAALALDWEIERNFRYFLYPSDVAAQRVARDLYAAKNGAAPTPEQLEHFINGPAFGPRNSARPATSRKAGRLNGRAPPPRPMTLSSNCAPRRGGSRRLWSRNSTGAAGRASSSASGRKPDADRIDRHLLESGPEAA